MQPAANVATKGNGQNVQKRVFIVLPSIALELFFTIEGTGRDSSSTYTIQLGTYPKRKGQAPQAGTWPFVFVKDHFYDSLIFATIDL
jgi:hypothetical protein